MLLVLIFVSAAITNLIGIFSIFGGFIVGAVLYDQREFHQAIRGRLHDFVTVFFLRRSSVAAPGQACVLYWIADT